MNIIQKNQIGHNLSGKFYGYCNGSRIYKVCRGFFQIQNLSRGHLSSYNGTKKEIESVMKHKIIKSN